MNYQSRVFCWMVACFGELDARSKSMRNHRFLEESLELTQACGGTREEALQLVDYVFSRPVGVAAQEVGGVMVTLAALCEANQLLLDPCAEQELERVWRKIEKIRAKHAAKPQFGPLPGPASDGSKSEATS